MSTSYQSRSEPSKLQQIGTRSTKKAASDRSLINAQALPLVPAIAKRLLPNGHVKGRYWHASLFSADKAPVKLSVDLIDGSWCDFHSTQKGPDIQSLISFIAGMEISEAQVVLKHMIGVE